MRLHRTEQQWIEEYQKKGALWFHDGNPKRPHALLTSGKHSNGFFNSRLVIEDVALLGEAAADLADLARHWLGPTFVLINRVVGPQTGATELAKLLSKSIEKLRDGECSWASPEKHGEGEEKKIVFTDSQQTVNRGDWVLLCEDVITTGGSIILTERAVEEADGIPISTVLALVNRSGMEIIDGGIKVLALINKSMPIWTPEECPLCKQGSEAIRPKGENWARLNAEY